MLSHSKVFLFSCLAFSLGVATRSFFALDVFFIFVCFLFLLFLFFTQRKSPSRKIALILAFSLIGYMRYELALLPFQDEAHIWHRNGENMEIMARVCDFPDQRIDKRHYVLCALRANGSGVFGRVRATMKLYPEYEYGDVLRLQGELYEPEPFDGFEYDRYLMRYKIKSVMYYPNAKKISETRDVLSLIFKAKSALVKTVRQYVPEPEASIVTAVVLGERTTIPENVREHFSRAGISHIIAISGLHISLLLLLALTAAPFFRVRRRPAFAGITLVLLAYIVLIGAPASAVRASLMGWLAVFSLEAGRLVSKERILLYALAAMLVINPLVLRDDIGFQLSFAAAWGIMAFVPRLQDRFSSIPLFFGLRDILFMTISAYVATLGLIILHFGSVSLIGPITNIVVLPALPVFMISALASLSVAFVFPPAAKYVFFLPSLLASFFVNVSAFLGRFEWAAAEVSGITPHLVVLYYAFVFYFAYADNKKPSTK